MLDKVDIMNREKAMHGNLIKWWNVQVEPVITDSEEDSADGLYDSFSGELGSGYQDEGAGLLGQGAVLNGIVANLDTSRYGLEEDERELLSLIMDKNDRSNVFENAQNALPSAAPGINDKNNDSDSQAKLDEANAIYERLMREAAEDEAAKQSEIEAAKKAALG